MKFSSSTACLIAGICIAGTGMANAADDAAAPAKSGTEVTRPFRHDPAATAQKRLDSLKKKLNLNASQQDAWQTYSASMLKLAQERAQDRQSRRSAYRPGNDLSTPEKLEKMAERMRKGADSLAKLAADTKTFYAQLTPEQKTIFDLSAKNAMRGRILQHMRRGEQPGPGMNR
jgi:protein CpxP